MKKILFIACSLFVATMLAGCLDKGKASSKPGSQTVIKSVDGSQKVDLAGTWKATHDKYTFKMIFGSDGSLRVDKEFNQWWYKGTYRTSGNVLKASCDELKSYVGSIGVEKGETQNFVISIVDNDELVIQTSGTGNTRTYKRQ